MNAEGKLSMSVVADMERVGDDVLDVTTPLDQVFENLPGGASRSAGWQIDEEIRRTLQRLEKTGLTDGGEVEGDQCLGRADAQEMWCYLLIEEATSLVKVEGKVPNPFLVVHAGEQEVRSKTVNETPFPLWNQILQIKVAESPCVLNVEVFHQPESVEGEEPAPVSLGFAEVVATEEHEDGFTDDWFVLKSDNCTRTGLGKVRIACSFDLEAIEALQRGLVPSTKRFRRLAQETWLLVEKDIDNLGVLFFMQIFEICPEILELFSFKDAPSLQDSPGMKNHANTVLRTVGRAVAGLKDLESLMPVLHGLGTRHARYGLKPMYLEILGQALLWTLEEALGNLWTPEVALAWTKTFGLVQSGIVQGLTEAIKDIEAKQLQSANITKKQP